MWRRSEVADSQYHSLKVTKLQNSVNIDSIYLLKFLQLGDLRWTIWGLQNFLNLFISPFFNQEFFLKEERPISFSTRQDQCFYLFFIVSRKVGGRGACDVYLNSKWQLKKMSDMQWVPCQKTTGNCFYHFHCWSTSNITTGPVRLL